MNFLKRLFRSKPQPLTLPQPSQSGVPSHYVPFMRLANGQTLYVDASPGNRFEIRGDFELITSKPVILSPPDGEASTKPVAELVGANAKTSNMWTTTFREEKA